jgi:hypothetical protein
MRASWWIVGTLAASMALPATADRLDDDLNTVWESVWDQRGSPMRVLRWEEPVRYKFIGEDRPRDRRQLVAALIAAGQAAGVDVAEASSAPGSSNIAIEFVGEDDLSESTACEAHVKTTATALFHARIDVRPSQAWECAYHEVMHAMGILGHPSGKTVLSYFPWRSDTLMPMDRVLLAAWYDRGLPAGATPFELLLHAGQHVTRQADLGVPVEQARARRQAHFEQRLREMEAFARGQGDVPMIIKRSGRASPAHIESARATMAYYLGLAYQRGTGMAADPVEAHRWLAAASRAGEREAHQELVSFEQRMAAPLLEQARRLGPR